VKPIRPEGLPSDRLLLIITAAIAQLAAMSAFVSRSARASERANPPTGRFVEVQGVKLHYTERGAGSPVVLLHGNGVTSRDWDVSGVVDGLVADHRVIAFDRPGYGYSDRPRGTAWTPAAQAALIHEALEMLGVVRPTVVGHSWGTLVALALALDHPADIERLVLVSGYYYPSLRLDAPLQVPAATPLLGDLLRHTILPLVGRLTAPLLVKHLFAPAPVPERFSQFPLALSLRPSQLRASAEEAVLMVPAAEDLHGRYGELNMPVAIVSGSGDKIVDPESQSNRLARQVLDRDADIVEGAGHMVHYFAPERVVDAVRGRAPAAPTPELTLLPTFVERDDELHHAKYEV
jgi:pimeloyl-ACP methyl ester carboxylesterase